MKKYLAIFTGSPLSAQGKKWAEMDEATRKKTEAAGMKAWGEWVAQNTPFIVDMGAPLGTTKRTDSEGISDIQNQMAAYTLVRAESHTAAAKLFLNHPHFMIFPGDGVEIMECLPIPEM